MKITAPSQANKIIFFISSYNLALFDLFWLLYNFVSIVYTQKTKLGTQFPKKPPQKTDSQTLNAISLFSLK